MARIHRPDRKASEVLGEWDAGELFSYGGPRRPRAYQVTKDRQDQAIAIALRMMEQSQGRPRVAGRFGRTPLPPRDPRPRERPIEDDMPPERNPRGPR